MFESGKSVARLRVQDIARIDTGDASRINMLLDKLLSSGFKDIDLNETSAFSLALIARYPDIQKVYWYRGMLMKHSSRFFEGVLPFRRASLLNLKDPASAYSLAECLWHIDRLDDFANVARRVFGLEPAFAELCQNLGNVLFQLGQKREAMRFYSRALCLERGGSQTFLGLANCLSALDEFGSARFAFAKGLLLDPQLPSCYSGMANVLEADRQFGLTVRFHQHACLLDSTGQAVWNFALFLLLTKKFGDAWPAYESRWSADGVPARWRRHEERTRTFNRPRVSSLPECFGRRVLVWAEQGVGDELMFGTMLKEFGGYCGRLLVEVDRRLLPLYRRSFGDEVEWIERGVEVEESRYDLQIPIGSLGLHLRPSVESFAGHGGGYLVADRDRAERLRASLGVSAEERLVGLSWRSADPESGASRSLPLLDLVESLRGPGVRFVSLQYGSVGEEIEEVYRRSGVRVLECAEVDNFTDLDGLASLLWGCDEVVTVGNATAHLAGSIGKRAHVLLPYVAGWRWMHEGNHSVWYDSLTLHRQAHRDDWRGVREQLSTAVSLLRYN